MAEPYLTMAEIEAKYPNEWVFLANPTTRRGSQAPTGGHVVFHCADHGECLRRVFDHPDVVDGAVWFTGPAVVDEVEIAIPYQQPR